MLLYSLQHIFTYIVNLILSKVHRGKHTVCFISDSQQKVFSAPNYIPGMAHTFFSFNFYKNAQMHVGSFPFTEADI